MRVTRVHVDRPFAIGDVLALPDDAAAHLVRVMRMQPGDSCLLFNGDGNDYQARLLAAGKRGAEVEVVAVHPVDNESPLRIVLLQGIARGEKMDWILQKAAELGVAGFVPVESERSEVRLDAARAGKRLAHWRSVVASACGQSGRARVPSVDAPGPLQARGAPSSRDFSRPARDAPGVTSGPVSAIHVPIHSTHFLSRRAAEGASDEEDVRVVRGRTRGGRPGGWL